MRYQKIESKIWNDEKFILLSPSEQRLFFYVLTSPHNNILGLYVLKSGYAAEDLKSLPKDFTKDLRKLCESGIIDYDENLQVVWVKNFLKHNPITNPNQKKALVRELGALPKSYLLRAFVEKNESLIKGLPEGLKKELAEGLSEVLSKPYTYTDSYSDTKKKEKVKRKNDEKPEIDSDESRLSLSKWFDEVMWPPVHKKVGKDLTWIAVQKDKPDKETRERMVWYFTEYPKVQAAYEAKGLFFPEMQDPVRVVKYKRYLDELVYPEEGANGSGSTIPHDNSWTEYCDIKAYRKAKAEGKKNITLNWELKHKYPEEV